MKSSTHKANLMSPTNIYNNEAKEKIKKSNFKPIKPCERKINLKEIKLSVNNLKDQAIGLHDKNEKVIEKVEKTNVLKKDTFTKVLRSKTQSPNVNILKHDGKSETKHFNRESCIEDYDKSENYQKHILKNSKVGSIESKELLCTNNKFEKKEKTNKEIDQIFSLDNIEIINADIEKNYIHTSKLFVRNNDQNIQPILQPELAKIKNQISPNKLKSYTSLNDYSKINKDKVDHLMDFNNIQCIPINSVTDKLKNNCKSYSSRKFHNLNINI